MKPFKVTAPDGRLLTVQGDDPEGAAKAAEEYVRANPLKGVAAYKAEKRASTAAADSKAPAGDKPVERRAASRALMNGMTLGGFGVAEAGVDAAIAGAKNVIARAQGKTPAYSMGDAYAGQREMDNQAAREHADKHPLNSLAMGLTGGVLMPGMGAAGGFIKGAAPTAVKAGVRSLPEIKALLMSAGIIPAVGRSAAVGAGMGGVSGALTADPDRMAEGAAHGATTGAVFGAALPVATKSAGAIGSRVIAPAAKAVLRTVNKATGGNLLDPVQEASTRLALALKKDGASPDIIRSTLDHWTTTGAPPPALMDVAASLPSGGQNTLRLLRAAASKGPASNLATKHLEQVGADVQDHAIARTRSLTPDTRPAGKVVEAVKAERSAQGRADYPAFMDHQIPVGDDLVSATAGGTGAKWMQHAADLAEAERNFPLAEEIASLSGDKPPKTISAGALEYIRRGMRDAADEHFNAGRGQLGSALKERSKDIETALMDVPGFDKARANWRGHSERIEAVDSGLGVLNAAPDEFASSIAGMTPGARETMKVGIRQAITDAIGKPSEASTGLLNRLSTSTNMKRNMMEAFGPDEGGRYAEAIGKTIDQLKNARFVAPNTNSATFSKLEDEGLVSVPEMPKSLIGGVLQILAKVQAGAALTDAERATIVQMGIGDAAAGAERLAPKLVPKAKRPEILPFFSPSVGAYAGRSDR